MTRPAASSSTPCVLSIDLGTSGPKAALVSTRGTILATAVARVATHFLPDGGAEQDPREIWAAVCTVSKCVLAEAQIAPASIVGVICSSQYASIVPVDADGEPTANMILWLDKRGAPNAMKAHRERGYRPDSIYRKLRWLRIHGLLPLNSGQDSLAHIRWFQYARPDIYRRTACFLEPMDFLTMKFTGRKVANRCSAFLMLLTDNRRETPTDWNPTLVRYAGIDRAKLPEFISDNTTVGTVRKPVADALGLSQDTQVIAGINDTQAAALACHVFQGDHGAIGIGTSSVMITGVPFKKTDPRTAMYTMPSPVPGNRFAVAENGVAGKALEHFLEKLIFAEDHFGNHQTEDKFQRLDQVVRTVTPGSNRLLFLPWVEGAMTPVTDSHMRGGFLNMSLQTTREDMARAVLEGVSLSFRWLRESSERFAGRSIPHYLFYGGGACSNVWPQINADILGAPVHQLENPRFMNCLGAALLAFERLGLIGFNDFSSLVPARAIYAPHADTRAYYEELFDAFKVAFHKNRRVSRKLNRLALPGIDEDSKH